MIKSESHEGAPSSYITPLPGFDMSHRATEKYVKKRLRGKKKLRYTITRESKNILGIYLEYLSREEFLLCINCVNLHSQLSIVKRDEQRCGSDMYNLKSHANDSSKFRKKKSRFKRRVLSIAGAVLTLQNVTLIRE